MYSTNAHLSAEDTSSPVRPVSASISVQSSATVTPRVSFTQLSQDSPGLSGNEPLLASQSPATAPKKDPSTLPHPTLDEPRRSEPSQALRTRSSSHRVSHTYKDSPRASGLPLSLPSPAPLATDAVSPFSRLRTASAPQHPSARTRSQMPTGNGDFERGLQGIASLAPPDLGQEAIETAKTSALTTAPASSLSRALSHDIQPHRGPSDRLRKTRGAAAEPVEEAVAAPVQSVQPEETIAALPTVPAGQPIKQFDGPMSPPAAPPWQDLTSAIASPLANQRAPAPPSRPLSAARQRPSSLFVNALLPSSNSMPLGPLASLLSPSTRTYGRTATPRAASTPSGPSSARAGLTFLGRGNGTTEVAPLASPTAPSLLSFLPLSQTAAEKPAPSPSPFLFGPGPSLASPMPSPLTSPLSSPLLVPLSLPLALTPLPRPAMSPPAVPAVTLGAPAVVPIVPAPSLPQPTVPLATRAAALLPPSLPFPQAFAMLAQSRPPQLPYLLKAAARAHARVLHAVRLASAVAVLVPPRYNALWRLLTCRGVRDAPRGGIRGAYRGAVPVWGESVPCAGSLASRVCDTQPESGQGCALRVRVDYLTQPLTMELPSVPAVGKGGKLPAASETTVLSEEAAVAALLTAVQGCVDRDVDQRKDELEARAAFVEAASRRDSGAQLPTGSEVPRGSGSRSTASRGPSVIAAAWRAAAAAPPDGNDEDEVDRGRDIDTRRSRKRGRPAAEEDVELGFGVPAVRCAQWYAAYAAAAARLASSGAWPSAEAWPGIGDGGRWLRALSGALDNEVRAAEKCVRGKLSE